MVLTQPLACLSLQAPANVVLTADAVNPDGSVARVDFYEGTNLIGTATAAPSTANWTNVASGSYSLTARATDNLGTATTSSPVTLNVSSPNSPPSITLTTPLEGAIFAAGANAVQAQSIRQRRNGGQGRFLRRRDPSRHGQRRLVESVNASLTYNGVPSGNHTLTAIATDNLNAATTSAPVHITVNVNSPPSVTLSSPANGASFRAPAIVNVMATASDSDGTVAKVEFYQGATLIGTATTSPYTATWSNVAAGNYAITAKATDNLGAITTSSANNITVTANAPPSVVLTAPTPGTTYFTPQR